MPCTCPEASIGWGEGGCNGWEWGYCTRGLGTLQAIKTGSGSRNKAARVGMLVLFKNEVGYNSHGQIATSLMPRPSHM